MHRTPRIALAALGVAVSAATLPPMLSVWRAASEPAPAGTVEFHLPRGGEAFVPALVDLRDDATEADRAALAARYGLELRPNSVVARDNRLFRVALPADRYAQLLDALRADPAVEAADAEHTFQLSPAEVAADRTDVLRRSLDDAPDSGTRPNDPRYDEQWNFKMVGAEDAWKKTRGKGIVVAVIDTGVSGQDTTKGKACRDFNTTAFAKGYDFVNDDDQPYDDHAHGTHVAGTIAESTNNNEGVAGLAYEATIMPLKVLSAGGSGTSGDIADAIRWAADKGAHVINMSLGSAFPDAVIHNACKYAHKKGVVIVAAAGNSFREGVGYPAAYPECIAVSSVGPSGNLAKYSSWGKQVAIAAPGGDMIDSGNAADGILQNTNYPASAGGQGDGYYAFQGTSMASPHVAAAAALVMAQGVKDPAKVKDILCKTAVKKNDAKKYGAGILNVAAATKAAGAETTWKWRHLLLLGMGGLMLVSGGRRRNLGLRAAMAVGLGAGFFVPDAFTGWVGADSAWNLLTFSALVPGALVLGLWNRAGLKAGGAFALGVGVCLIANLANGTVPFTAATFGAAALPWTVAQATLAIGLSLAAGLRASRR